MDRVERDARRAFKEVYWMRCPQASDVKARRRRSRDVSQLERRVPSDPC